MLVRGVGCGGEDVRSEEAGRIAVGGPGTHYPLGCLDQAAGEGLLVAVGLGGFDGVGVSGDLAYEGVKNELSEDGLSALACGRVDESVGVEAVERGLHLDLAGRLPGGLGDQFRGEEEDGDGGRCEKGQQPQYRPCERDAVGGEFVQ